LELQQELLFSIERIIKQNNAEFAIPIQATILQMESGKQGTMSEEKLENYSVS